MPDYYTERGFAMFTDIPTREGNFTVQESSAAYIAGETGPWVWVGIGDERAHLSVEEAARVRDGLTEFIRRADHEAGETDLAIWDDTREAIFKCPRCGGEGSVRYDSVPESSGSGSEQ